MLERMDSLLKLAAVGVGGFALYKWYEASKEGVPLGIVFSAPNIFRPIGEVKAEWLSTFAPAPAGVKVGPFFIKGGVRAAFPLPGGGSGAVKFAPSGVDLSVFTRTI